MASYDSAYDSDFDFALEDFNINKVLGYGRTKIYNKETHQLALKAIDLWKQSELLPELHNEIEIYQILSDLLLLNDLRIENILVDENDKVYLIDFGFATVDSFQEAQQKERDELSSVIESL